MEALDTEPNLLKKLLFFWIFPIVSYYKQNKPSYSNLLNVSHQDEHERYLSSLKENFKKSIEFGEASFLKAFIHTFSLDFLQVILVSLGSLLLMLLDCVMIYYMILYIKDEESSRLEGIFLAGGIIIETLLCITVSTYAAMSSLIFSAKVRRIFVSLVSEKCLHMHGCEISNKDTQGKCFNLITGDLNHLDGLRQISMFIAVMISYVFTFSLVGIYFGVWGIFGILVSFLHIPLMLFIGNSNREVNSKLFVVADKRIKLIEKVIEGIQILKLYAWEIPYLNLIYKEKETESQLQRTLLNVNVTFLVLSNAGNILILFISMAFHSLTGGKLVSSEVFFQLSIILLVQGLAVILSVMGIKALFDILPVLNRMEEIMLTKEINIKHTEVSGEKKIELESVIISWVEREKVKNKEDLVLIRSNKGFELSEITFKIENHGLMIVVGPSGSGKSTLLMALLGELFIEKGDIYINGSMSYAAQDPWLIPDTVKNNIIIGKEFNENRYKLVLELCDMFRDITILPNGDESIVGDRGITLSGGQKARIGLARALYADSDIFILDDPLSAVDTKVGNHLFQTIKELSQKKIVILVTHQLHYLAEADIVVVLDHGNQVFCGKPQQLLESSEIQELLGSINLGLEIKRSVNQEEYKKNDIVSVKEDEMSIYLNFQTYLKYTLMGFKSKIVFFMTIVFMLPSQFAFLYALYWCTLWIDSGDSDSSYYIWGLGIICAAVYLTFIIRVYPFCNFLINSNKNMHNSALQGLTQTYSSYFDTNSSGVLINRFCKDSSSLGNQLIIYYFESISYSLHLSAITIVICVVIPYALVVLPILFLMMYWLFTYFNSVIIEVKRMELIAKGPLLTTYNSILSGYATIRSFNLYSYFLREAEHSSLRYYKADYALQLVTFFAQFYILLTMSIIVITNLIVVIATKNTIDSVLVGFILSLSTSYIKVAGFLNKFMIEVHSLMCSTQRLIEFSELPAEGAYCINSDFTISKGSIRFLNICMRYRPECPLALNNLNLSIEGGTKFGIVGRTGAGKSSIMQVLFRLVVPESGVILIDKRNYMMLGLHDLRKQFSIITQNSFLFNASIRDNLDPFHEHSNEELLEVIDEVRLRSLVVDETYLDTLIVGQHIIFSAGQKQLLCLARSILRKNRIIIMDEATSSIDHLTDKIMQEVVRTNFMDCTLIVIAHRLRSIIDSDKIAVIENGECREIGKPGDLFRDEESRFRNLVLNTGSEETQYLISQLQD